MNKQFTPICGKCGSKDVVADLGSVSFTVNKNKIPSINMDEVEVVNFYCNECGQELNTDEIKYE